MQFARASSLPAGRNSRSIGRGVRGFKLVMVSAVSASSWRFRGRGARARTLELRAPAQVECDESGAVGERLKRPWEEQWAKGAEVSVNLHWWSRRSVLQVGDFEAAGRGHGPLRPRQYDTSTLVRLLQFARASSVPAGWKRRRIGKGVRGFKLVMVSATTSSAVVFGTDDR